MHNHDLESALGELECAALLAVPEFHFKFVTPTGVKGKDYDAEIVTSAGRTVCCEIKSKSEHMERVSKLFGLHSNALENSCRKVYPR
jgi:hypothetical protein